jgi:hypothetical protein
LRRSATEPRDKGIDSDICFGKLVDEAVEGHSIGTGSALVRHQLPWNKVSYCVFFCASARPDRIRVAGYVVPVSGSKRSRGFRRIRPRPMLY